MQLSEPLLRTVLLAGAIERADAQGLLVSQPERDEALRQAVAAARGRGVQRVAAPDVAADWARAVVQRASERNAGVAALAQPSAALQWLAWGLPALALLLGLAADRIANAHRVDLLSPPLLLVLAWNGAMYLLLAWRALRGHGAPARWAPALRQRLRPRVPRHAGAPGQRALAAQIAAQFYGPWFAQTSALFARRAARVMHLSAAAGAAGIALSLLLRGLVVRYQFGWESTFLDAAQMHALARVLFLPLTALFGLQPFSLQEIAATQNFAGEGAAGSRWVWMYVGLLALVVVLPRLALAAWARWRQAQLAARLALDPQGDALQALAARLPRDVLLGLVALSAQQAQALQTLLAGHAEAEPAGHRLRWLQPEGADARQAVDAVLLGDAPQRERPAAWQHAPSPALPWERWAASWVLEPALFDRLAPLLPGQQGALQRLRSSWVQASEARFAQALQLLADHLREGAALAGQPAQAERYPARLQQLAAALAALHGHGPAAPPPGPPATPARGEGSRRWSEGAFVALGSSAGAAAGAKAGALLDLGLGGLTLGAGTAVGGLLGASAAWLRRALQKRQHSDELLQHMVEMACLLYLASAHQGRMAPAQAERLAPRWRAEVTGAVAAHWPALLAALQAGPRAAQAAPHAPALAPLLQPLLRGVLQRSLSPEGGGQDGS
ncbi:DUF2868 domain-containing protein [Pulveribacter suum]|uniref:DUF2868 domain-containing protein n=1 Tax=Pulveribacter suum TaxID=2116657 RepID=A0A2P1NI30_9BURK|nr:DUF2868 domain-containing protein [Pulveribacter suum]AVP56713.1 hypothetical protein C7H73_02790 [Pulveribacter suum]